MVRKYQNTIQNPYWPRPPQPPTAPLKRLYRNWRRRPSSTPGADYCAAPVPIGDLISVPFQNNVNFPTGEFSRIQNVLNIQPVVPIHVSEDWLLISRWIIPVVYQPNLGSACRSSGPIATEICDFRERNSAPDGGANGLGDLNPTFFLSPAHPGKLIWGIEPTLLLPTATDPTLGQGKWGAGPSIVLLVQPKHWTIGVLSNNIWSFAGNQ
jgi:hypothetical protein